MSSVWAEYKEQVLSRISDFSFVFSGLKQQKESTDGWVTACCPFHDDRNPSFAYNRESGQWACFASCGKGSVFDFIMLMSKVDFKYALCTLGEHAGISPPEKTKTKRISIQDLARDKGLPVDVLKKFGVVNLERGGVKIPYFNPDGSPAKRHRLRYALNAKDGSRWTKGKDDIIPYCLHYLKYARNRKYLILVEGESDCWTLWYHKFPALGLPGAETAQKLKRTYFDEIDKVYILKEPDDGGETFVRGILNRVYQWKTWNGRAFIVTLENAKDPNDLFKKNKTEFKNLMQKALDTAQPAPPPPEPAPPETAYKPEDGDNRISINVNNLFLDTYTLTVVRELHRQNTPPVLYVRGGVLCRVVCDEHERPHIGEMTKATVRHRIAQCVYFTQSRSESGMLKYIAPPEKVVESVMSLGEWPFPALVGIATSPILRPDGTVCSTPGYDPETAMVYLPEPGLVIPPLPEDPTPAEREKAACMLLDLLGDFPFQDRSSRANALSLVFSVLMRPAITGSIPFLLIDAPVQGSGKTLLATVIGIICAGSVAVMTVPSRSRDAGEEWRKRITSLLVEGPSLILIDNLPDGERIDSPHLASVLTSGMWKDRKLGTNDIIEIPARAVWVGTGNNIRLARDMPRRCYTVKLDCNTEKPWERSGFRYPDLMKHVKENRGTYLAAAFTLIRAWYAAGCPEDKSIPTYGSFEEWSVKVGSVLLHAGIHGFLGNLDLIRSEQDEDTRQWQAFFIAWIECFGTQAVTTEMLCDHIIRERGLSDEALPDILLTMKDRGEGSFKRSLGHNLSRLEGRIFDSYKLVTAGKDPYKKVKKWVLKPVDTPQITSNNLHSGEKMEVVEINGGYLRSTDARNKKNDKCVKCSGSGKITSNNLNNLHNRKSASEPSEGSLFNDKSTDTLSLKEQAKRHGLNAEEIEERAAIMQYDNGMSREDAEKEALRNALQAEGKVYK